MTDQTAGEGAFTLSSPSGTYYGVFHEQNEVDPMDPTGTKRIRELWIDATRTQFAVEPVASPRPTLTALGKTWSVQAITHQPYHYHFVCRPA